MDPRDFDLSSPFGRAPRRPPDRERDSDSAESETTEELFAFFEPAEATMALRPEDVTAAIERAIRAAPAGPTAAEIGVAVAAAVGAAIPAPAAPVAPARPRAGGLAMVDGKQVAWTGGSNLPSDRVGWTRKSAGCFRPESLKGKILTEKACVEGLSEERRLDQTSGNQVQIATWVRNLKDKVEAAGMDTVFRVPTLYTPAVPAVAAVPASAGVAAVAAVAAVPETLTDTAGTEIYILEQWGQVTEEQVKKWIEWLRDNGDIHDTDNLSMSARAICDSLGATLWDTVEKETTENTTGPEVFLLVLGHVQASSSQAVRDLVSDLEKMTLMSESGENVTTFTNKVADVCRRIEGSGQPPPDLALVVAKTLSASTVTMFQLEMYAMYNELDKNLKAHTWQGVLLKAKTKYTSMSNSKLWTAAQTKKTDEIAALKAEVATLKSKVSDKSNSGSGNGNSRRTDTRTCFNCGEKGHISPNCPKKGKNGNSGNSGNNQSNNNNSGAGSSQGETKKKSPYRQPPGTDDPKEKTIDGVSCSWCGKCGRWTHGDKKHTTETHVKRPKPGDSTPASGTEGANLGASSSDGGHCQLVGTFGLFGGMLKEDAGRW